MSEPTFAVVFRGDLVLGHSLPEVKQQLQRLFKADTARIDSLFTGKPMTLKTGLPRSEAERYQKLLQQAGAAVTIEAAVRQPAANPAPTASPSSVALTMAPVGSLMSTTTTASIAPPPDTSHLQVLPQQGELLAAHERSGDQQPLVDVDQLDWSLGAEGETLLSAEERVDVAPVAVDVSTISLADPEGNLLRDDEQSQPVVADIDTDHLRLTD